MGGPCSNLGSRRGWDRASTQGRGSQGVPPRERRSAPLWRGLSGAPSGCPGPLTGGSCLCRPGAPACGPRLEVPGLGTLGRGPASHPRGLHLKPAVAKACSSSLTSWIFRAVLACNGWDCLGIYLWPPRGKGSYLPLLCLKTFNPPSGATGSIVATFTLQASQVPPRWGAL